MEGLEEVRRRSVRGEESKRKGVRKGSEEGEERVRRSLAWGPKEVRTRSGNGQQGEV